METRRANWLVYNYATYRHLAHCLTSFIASIWGSNNTKEDKRPLQQPDFKRMPTGGEIMESIINPSSTARILQACGVSKEYIDTVCGPEWRDVSMIQ